MADTRNCSAAQFQRSCERAGPLVPRSRKRRDRNHGVRDRNAFTYRRVTSLTSTPKRRTIIVVLKNEQFEVTAIFEALTNENRGAAERTCTGSSSFFISVPERSADTVTAVPDACPPTCPHRLSLPSKERRAMMALRRHPEVHPRENASGGEQKGIPKRTLIRCSPLIRCGNLSYC